MYEMTHKELFSLSRKLAKKFVIRTGGHHLREELEQEAAIAIMRAQEKYNADKGSFLLYAKVWAYAKMRRYLNDQGVAVRNTGKDRDLMMPACMSYNPAKDRRVAAAEALETAAVNQALSRLDLRTQVMLEARLSGGQLEEIAEGFGVSRETVRKKIKAFGEVIT